MCVSVTLERTISVAPIFIERAKQNLLYISIRREHTQFDTTDTTKKRVDDDIRDG